jgi:thioredoxin reductase
MHYSTLSIDYENMEKQATTSINDIRKLVEKSEKDQKTLVISVGDSGVAIIATGSRARLLRRLIKEFDD